MNLTDKIANLKLKQQIQKDWLAAHAQPTPMGYEPLKLYKDTPPTHFMKPEDMNHYLKSDTILKLLRQNKEEIPTRLDYPTVAFNIENPKYPNPYKFKQEAILISSQSPENKFLPIMGLDTLRGDYGKDIPEEALKYIPQGIYEHEYAHYKDRRIDPKANNKGYIKRFGIEGHLAERERIPIEKENIFWNKLKNMRIK